MPLCDYVSLFDPKRTPQPIWVPLPPPKKPKQIVRCGLDGTLPPAEQHSVARVRARARATVALLMLVVHGELDWHYEEGDLLVAGALLLLDDDDEGDW